MGSFNVACAMTNLPISAGDEIYAIPVYESENYRSGFGDWVPWGALIEGKYDDYGSIEDVVESPFTKLLKDTINFDFEKNRIEGIDPYSSYDNSINRFIPNFKSRIDFSHIEPPVVDGRFEEIDEKFNLKPLETLGFEVIDNRNLKFGEISGKISQSPEHAVVWWIDITFKGSTHRSQVSDVGSLLAAFRISQPKSLVKYGNETYKYPAITVEEAEALDFMAKSDTIFIHKNAFDKYFSTVMSDVEKYEMEFNNTRLVNSCKMFIASNSGMVEGLPFDFIKSAKDSFIYNMSRSTALQIALPMEFAKYFISNPESYTQLQTLFMALMCHGKTFAPMGHTFQDSHFDLSTILSEVAVEQLDILKKEYYKDEE